MLVADAVAEGGAGAVWSATALSAPTSDVITGTASLADAGATGAAGAAPGPLILTTAANAAGAGAAAA